MIMRASILKGSEEKRAAEYRTVGLSMSEMMEMFYILDEIKYRMLAGNFERVVVGGISQRCSVKFRAMTSPGG